MSGDSSNAMQDALRSALLADPAISGLIGDRVVDWPAANDLYPCATVGDIIRAPWRADGLNGSELTVTIHTWAKGTSGRDVARQVGEAITTLLDENAAAVRPAGHRVVVAESTLAQVIRDEAGDAQLVGSTAHGIYRFRFLTVPAE